MKFLLSKNFVIASLVAVMAAVSCTKDADPIQGSGAGIEIKRMESGDTTKIMVEFLPEEVATKYEYALGTESDYSAFEYGEMAGIAVVEGNQSSEIVFEGLEPNTAYTVFARAYTGDVAGGVATLKVKTADNKFRVEMQYVHENSVGFLVTMTSNYSSCRYYLGTAEDKEKFLNNEIEGETMTNVVGSRGVNYFDLEKKDYVFYAIGYDRTNNATGLYEFPVVLKEKGSCPSATFEVLGMDAFRGKYKVTPNELCGKVTCVIGEVDQFVSISEGNTGFKGNLLRWITSWETVPDNGNSFTAINDVLSFTYDDTKFGMGTDMEVFILTYDKDYEPAGIQRIAFKKNDVDPDAKPATAEIVVSDITSTGATYTITPGEHTMGMMYNTLDAVWFDSVRETSEYYDTYVHEMFMNMGMYWSYCADNNGQPVVYVEQTGFPDSRFYAAVCPMNVNGVKGWGDLVLKEYTTAAM